MVVEACPGAINSRSDWYLHAYKRWDHSVMVATDDEPICVIHSFLLVLVSRYAAVTATYLKDYRRRLELSVELGGLPSRATKLLISFVKLLCSHL